MKNLYEGMFILPKSLSDDDQEGVLGRVRTEIEKLGGAVRSKTRLGKKAFAHPLKKQEAGHYAVMTFDLEGEKIAALRARLKLNESIMRVQFVRAQEAAEAPAGAAKEEKGE